MRTPVGAITPMAPTRPLTESPMRALLFALALLPAALAAQSTERPLRVIVSGGLQVPTGGFADYHDLGVHADAALLLSVGGFKFRPELSYSRFNLKDAFEVPSVLGQSGGAAAGGARRDAYDGALSTLLGGFANIELPLGQGGVQPFLLGGVGAVNVKSDAATAAEAVSDVKASFNIGAGIRFRLGGISGLIEARVNDVPSSDTRAFFKGVRTIPVTFGLVF